MSVTLSSAPGLLALFDSSTTMHCFRFKTLSTSNKVVRTGLSLEVRYGSQHFAHKGAIVMLSSQDYRFCAFGEITSLIDGTKFTVNAAYGKSDGTDDASNAVPVQLIFMAEASVASWVQRAMEDERVAGAFDIAFVPSRGSRNGVEALAEMKYIRQMVNKPTLVIGSMSSNNDLLDTAVNVSTVMSTFTQNLEKMLGDGHSVAITNVKPLDRVYGTPNTTQERALLQLNQFYNGLAKNKPDVAVIDWYSRFVNPTDSNGGAKTGLHRDSVHFNADGANEASKDVADLLSGCVKGKPPNVLRFGLWDGPARGNGVGANLCAALQDGNVYVPSDTGASGSLSTHMFLSGVGGARTSVSSVAAMADGSYRQRLVITGGLNDSVTIRLEGPTGAKYAAQMVAGATYQFAMRYALSGLAQVSTFEVIADATINYPTLGAVVGYLGAGSSYQGEPMIDTPDVYPITAERSGVMVLPSRMKIPSDALSIDAFGVNIKIKFKAVGGTCTIDIDHPTLRRLT